MKSKRWLSLKRIWSETKWFVLAVLWFLGILLGYLGFAAYAESQSLDWGFMDTLYRSLQLISMNSGGLEGEVSWMLDAARYFLPALTALTAFQALTNIFREQTQWLRLWRLKDHIVVCGLGRKGTHLVEDLLAMGCRVVVIEAEIDPISANEYRRNGAVVLEGDATDLVTLEAARVGRASHLICFLGQDRNNLRILHQSLALIDPKDRSPLTCILHLASKALLDLVKQSELSLGEQAGIRIETFNVYDQAARNLIQGDAEWQNLPEKAEITGHLLVVGLGRLGQNLVTQAGYTWYRKGSQSPLKITVIDLHADAAIDELLENKPQLKTVCQFEAVQLDVSSNTRLFSALATVQLDASFEQVYICLGDSILSMQVCLALMQSRANRTVPLWVRLENRSGLAELLKDQISKQSARDQLHCFDIYEQTCSHTLVVGGEHELLARKLRENFLQELGTKSALEQLKLSWEEVPEEEKQANRAQADRIYRLLQAAGYEVNALTDWDAADRTFNKGDVEAMAQMEHRLWCDWKRSQGWRAGEARNPRLKTNPDLVEWEDLEEVEKDKNRNFIRKLHALLAEIGLQID